MMSNHTSHDSHTDEANHRSGPRTVLVVDDEPHIRYMLELKLRAEGFRVLTATNGRQAFDLASQRFPDVVITDFQMPGGNGVELCKRLLENPTTSQIPVILLTARGHRIDDDVDLSNVRERLSKPFSPRELVTRVQSLSNERRPEHTSAPGESVRGRA